jgi:DNA-binding transcriptional MerR regulator
MRTVKEVSELTSISVRTLHYYDEIGLLKPTAISDAKYRLYDDKALETLQQILFFREFDMPLKDIQTILNNPSLDKNQILESQKKMLLLKKERLERLINSIDNILKGENKMDFEVFNQSEIEELYQSMISHMPEELKKSIIKEWGSLEQHHKHYIEIAASEKHQKIYEKMVEWYGDKESAKNAALNPPNSDIIKAYEKRCDVVMKRLAEKQGEDVTSFEVKAIIGEYGFILKQLYQVKDEKLLMLDVANSYRNGARIREAVDERYGVGVCDYFVRGIEGFYRG